MSDMLILSANRRSACPANLNLIITKTNMNGAYIALVTLITVMGVVIYAYHQEREECHMAGGSYLSALNLCIKSPNVININ